MGNDTTTAGRGADQFAAICDWDNLRLAYYRAAKGKRLRPATLAYRNDLDTNLRALRSDLDNLDDLVLGNYRFFTIHDPKERIICEAPFGERVLHHAIMRVLEPRLERYQIHDSYACRVGKGTEAALRRALYFCRRNRFFGRLDVRKYFDSVDHGILKTQLSRLFKNPRVRHLLFRIIDSYHTAAGKGLPIGNLTSQFFANHYVAGLDHYVLEQCAAGGYLRYMDDMVVFGNDRRQVAATCDAISDYCARRL